MSIYNTYERQSVTLFRVDVVSDNRLRIIINLATLQSHYQTVRYHYNDVIISSMASQNTDVSIVYSAVCSGPGHWLILLTKGQVTRKMFPFDDIIMILQTTPQKPKNIFDNTFYYFIAICDRNDIFIVTSLVKINRVIDWLPGVRRL